MIRYADHGDRCYGDRPWPPHTRCSWEFQAVVAGRCALWLPGRHEWRTATLWLLPPECSHGWTAVPGSTCRICVIHVPDVPDVLRLLAREHGFLEAALDAPAVERLTGLTAEAMAIARGDPLVGLRGDRIRAELCLLLAERLKISEPQRWAAPASPERLVEEALAWFCDHLPHQPTVNDVAAALRCSPGHLRRQFLRVRGETPLAALAELRLRRAEELLADRALTIDHVAQHSGFADGSTLARAYRRARGQPPSRLAGRRAIPPAR